MTNQPLNKSAAGNPDKRHRDFQQPGWRGSLSRKLSGFRLVSQARYKMGAPNGLFTSRIVVAVHAGWSRPPSTALLRPASAVALLRRMERTGVPELWTPGVMSASRDEHCI